MTTRNDITGDALITRAANENYRNNYDLIFGKKKPEPKKDEVKPEEPKGDAK